MYRLCIYMYIQQYSTKVYTVQWGTVIFKLIFCHVVLDWQKISKRVLEQTLSYFLATVSEKNGPKI